MNDYEENIGCLFIMLFATAIVIGLFLISYYNLSKFKTCYDNSFKYAWCEKYKNY